MYIVLNLARNSHSRVALLYLLSPSPSLTPPFSRSPFLPPWRKEVKRTVVKINTSEKNIVLAHPTKERKNQTDKILTISVSFESRHRVSWRPSIFFSLPLYFFFVPPTAETVIQALREMMDDRSAIVIPRGQLLNYLLPNAIGFEVCFLGWKNVPIMD